eukprot:3774444-Rhodomonas_salina.2
MLRGRPVLTRGMPRPGAYHNILAEPSCKAQVSTRSCLCLCDAVPDTDGAKIESAMRCAAVT